MTSIKYFLRGAIHFYKRTDLLLVGLCLLCSSVSFLLIWGISLAGYVKFRVFQVQLAATIIGFIIACVISLIDYHLLARFWKLFLPLSVGLVALTYVIGEQRYSYIDDKAWLKIPFTTLSFQPSEILKIAFIFTLALHLEKARDSINDPKTLMTLCGHGGLVTLMIVFQGDDGSAMVFVAIFCCMVFAAGVNMKYVTLAGAAALLVSPLVWFFILDADKRARILTVINPAFDPTNIGWQQGKGIVSIGAGQIWGKGIFNSEALQYIPEMHNDFIFAFAGEAVGFVGCAGIIITLGIICVAILINARKAKDLLGRYICIGVFAVFAFQSIWGIGMCLSLLPVAGLTLPLFSAGGTSIVMTYASIGLVLNVHRYSYDGLFAGN